MDWNELGLKMGLEIHQQLNTKQKLFCPCNAELVDEKCDVEIKRELRPTQGELGQIDRAAFQESMRNLKFNYEVYNHQTCLVETDDEPPHNLNKEALDLTMTIATLLNMEIVDEFHTMRKQVIDGSNTGGYQRTGLVATDGHLDTPYGKVIIENLCLEEDAAKKIAIESKKEYIKEFAHYRLDRLGIPLVEITTDPSIHHPEQVKEVAYAIGQILRSTNVKRGLGTIRQDLNISIDKGARVEIKGVQNLDLMPKIVENEVKRQLKLIEIKQELINRNVEVKDEIYDLDNVFKNTSSKILSSATSIKCILLKGFAGLIGEEVQPGRRFGTEIASYAKKRGVSGIFHTDELPAYGITLDEVKSMRHYLNAKENDAVIIVAHDEEIAISALEEVKRRVNMAFEGVIEETRKSLDDGNTEYMRPLPTSSRMYLETDIPSFQITKDTVKHIENNLPELPNDKKNRIIAEYGLSEDLANQLVRRLKADDFETIFKEVDVDPTTLASTLAYNIKEIKREGYDIDKISLSKLVDIFRLLEDKKISKDALNEILIGVATDSEDNVEDLAEKLNLLVLDEEKVRKIIEDIVDNNSEMVKKRKMGSIGPLMGISMKQLKGKADGKLVNNVLKEKIEKLI